MTHPFDSTHPTLDDLEAIYSGAFYKTMRDNDGDLVVRTEHYFFCHTVNKHGFVRVVAYFHAREGVDEGLIYALANEFNAQVHFVKCYYYGGPARTLIFETDMNTEGGLVPVQLVTRLRAFERILDRSHPMDEVIGPAPTVTQPQPDVASTPAPN